MLEVESAKEVVKALHTDEAAGLSKTEAAARLKRYGRNCLEEGRTETLFQAVLQQLNDPLIYVLLAAAVISGVLGEIGDALIIMIVVLINAVVGLIQEGRAQKALESLKKLSEPKAVVKRDGLYQEIDAEELVIGDIVSLEAGRQVPADLRLIQSVDLHTEEAMLTGESLPVEKDASSFVQADAPIGERKNTVFMSTFVTRGRGEGVVTATGMQTELGGIAKLIQGAPKDMTPLQKRLADLGKLLSITCLVLCVALFVVAVIQGRNFGEMFLTSISLAVAAVPEGLPAVVTIVLALSVFRMVRIHTIVRRLPSVETLGSVSVVCSDKTGTLTQNIMTVTDCYLNNKLQPAGHLNRGAAVVYLEGFCLCNDAVLSDMERLGDPTELALLEMGKRYGITKERLKDEQPRAAEIPFDSERKRMTTMHRSRGRVTAYTKGALELLLPKCQYIWLDGGKVPLEREDRERILKAAGEMSSRALRVLALAMTDSVSESALNSPNETWEDRQQMVFVGLAGMIDPPRMESAPAVEAFREAGVKTVMITGDHLETAFAIAKELGIAKHPQQCMTGEQLASLSEEECHRMLPEITVFARVSPEHKVRIVKVLQAQGNIVAMTGDGVNDAPSLKAADIGIAMGQGGTDVARQAADLVLTDDNFSTIQKAIREGRAIYENIKKTVLFLLSSNFGEIATMFCAICCGLAAPLKASHILWINLITDTLPALALGVDKMETDHLMKRPPRRAKESLFSHGGLSCTLFYGFLIAAISLSAFLILPFRHLQSAGLEITLANIRTALSQPLLLARAQTYAFTVLGMSQLVHAIGMRDVEHSAFRMKIHSNYLMLVALIAGIALQIAVTEIPALVQAFGTTSLSLGEWLELGVLSCLPLAAHELFVITAARLPGRSKEYRLTRRMVR